VVASLGTLRTGPLSSFADRAFQNEINAAVHAARAAYDKLLFREALKVSWCVGLGVWGLGGA
jgi:leucyl-tRNA synthetase